MNGDSDQKELIQQTHDDLVEEHGANNVLVIEVEGEVISLVGQEIGSINLIEGQTHEKTHSPPLPERWEDVDMALIPIFESPENWLGESNALINYEMESFGMGKVSNITPHGVTFKVTHKTHKNSGFIQKWRQKFDEQDEIGDAIVVEGPQKAINQQSTWIDLPNPNEIVVYEFFPFLPPMKTTEEFKEKMEFLLEESPDLDDLLATARQRAHELHTPEVTTTSVI